MESPSVSSPSRASLIGHALKETNSNKEVFYSPQSPSTSTSTPRNQSIKSSPNKQKEKLKFLSENQRKHWMGEILREFKKGLETIDLRGNIGKIPNRQMVKAFNKDSFLSRLLHYPSRCLIINSYPSYFLRLFSFKVKMGMSESSVVERIERTPNRSYRISPVRWFPGDGGVRQCNTIEEFALPRKILESKSTMTTICGPFLFSSLPEKGDQKRVVCFSPGRMATYVVVVLSTRMPSWSKSPFYTSKDAGSKETCTKDVFFSALFSPKAKEENVSLFFNSSFGFLRIAVTGEKPIFFSLRMREKVRGKNTFSLCEIRKWRTHSIRWVHRIKRKAALSWQSFRWQETLGLIGASERNESKPKIDQGSLPAKPIGEGLKDGTCKVDRAPVV
ncbi:60S ribosomal protein L2, mitochondrial [Capsicum annuum]|uniref:60S ribosomal protein L2, mitochondrial n=1 Tax=Capsicum annuum TaxID=4072 RepID=A0A2G2YM45_CAPAN|nr:60S ribosomal protein L2, mitochondrial [Capsicum annuum]